MALIDSKELLKKAVWIYDEEGFGTRVVKVDEILKMSSRDKPKWDGVYLPHTEYRLVGYKCPKCGALYSNQPEKCAKCCTELSKYEEKA